MDTELRVTGQITRILDGLEPNARARVLSYLWDRFGPNGKSEMVSGGGAHIASPTFAEPQG